MTAGKVYTLDHSSFNELTADPSIARESLYSLSMELRAQYVSHTPLFEQQTADGLPVFAIVAASATESFYRSALNCMINAKLTGKMGALFPKCAPPSAAPRAARRRAARRRAAPRRAVPPRPG